MSRVCEFAKFATFGRVCSSLPSLRHIWVAVLLPFLLTPLLTFWLSIGTSPARAQGVLVTPTPYPAIIATQNAAQQAQAQASASLQQAAQLRAQAAEMERNGQAQYAQAQADINAARAAQAAQNAAAAGEAIGRVEATINQMRDTVAGQASIIATLTAKSELRDGAIVSLTIELQQARADKQVILSSYSATAQRLEDVQRQSQAVPVVTLVIGILFASICAVLIVVVLQRKGQDAPSTPIDHEDIIEGEVSDETPRDSSGSA